MGELTPLLDGRGDGQTTLLGGHDGGHTTVKHVLQLLLKHSCMFIYFRSHDPWSQQLKR